MIAEHVIDREDRDARDLGFCATDMPHSGITKDEWILDSGCTVHVTHNRDVFTSFTSSNKSSLKGVGGEIQIDGYGDVKIGHTTLSDVAYAPDLPYNLLSVQKAISKSEYSLLFNVDHKVKVLDKKGYIRALAHLKNNIYVIDFYGNNEDVAMSAYDVEISSSFSNSHNPLLSAEKSATPKVSILHASLGHPGIKSYNCLASVVGAPKLYTATVTVYPTCSVSKGTIQKGIPSLVGYTSPLQLIQLG